MVTLSAAHYNASRRFEPQRLYNFEVSIAGLSDDITLAVSSFTMPKVGTGEIELPHGNTSVFVAGKPTYEAGSFVINDAIGADIEAQLLIWYRMVYDERTDQVGWAQDYQRQATIYQYSPDGLVSRKWSVIGLWPTNIDFGDMSYETADKKTISMTVRYYKAVRI